MATSRPNFWSKFGFWKDLAVALGADVLFKAFVDKFGKTAVDHVTSKVLNDQRAELMDDLRLMENSGIKIDNLRRRLKEARAIYREDFIVEQLTKICKKAKTRRRDTLKWLNDMDDGYFEEMIELLNHDVIFQMFQRFFFVAGKFVQRSYTQCLQFLETCRRCSAPGFRSACAGTKTFFKEVDRGTEEILMEFNQNDAPRITSRLNALADFVDRRR